MESESNGFIKQIKRCFIKYDDETEANYRHPFTSLPSALGAHIVSFSDMYDRIKYELVSKDLYKFNQTPSARYHLVIDHKFARGLYSDSIDIRKHLNAQSVEIKYVFYDSCFGTFQAKYYSLIAQILSISVSSYIKVGIAISSVSEQFEFNRKRPQSPCTYWPFIENKNSLDSVFKSVTKLIYIPSQNTMDNNSGLNPSWWRKKFNLLLSNMPNLTSFVMPTTRMYSGNHHFDDHDFEWKVFKEPGYQHKLEVIECNLVNKTRYPHRGFLNDLRTFNHPLSHFYNFSQLKSLKLALPVSEDCVQYYCSLLAMNYSSRNAACVNLKEL